MFPRERLEEETLAYAQRVADNWLRDPIRLHTFKFSINHMMDTTGFTAELEAAYQSYFIVTEMRDREIARDDKDGIAQTRMALQNLELTKPWLESTR